MPSRSARTTGIARKPGVRGKPVTVFAAKDGGIAQKHSGGIAFEEPEKNIGTLLQGG